MEKIKIFVADDNQQYVDYLISIIAKQPNMCLVDSANNGEEAIRKMRNAGVIDILIMDMVMPQLDGYALLKQLKEGIYGVTIKHTICMSALVNEKVLNLISTYGGDMFVIKPFKD